MYSLDPTQLTLYLPRHAEDQIREESNASGAYARRAQPGSTVLAPHRAETRARGRDRRRRLCARGARARSRRAQRTYPQKQRRSAEIAVGGVSETVAGKGISLENR